MIWQKFTNLDIRFKYTLFILAMCFLPLLSELDIIEYSALSVWAYIIVFSVVAIGLNVLLGFSGLISLSTAGFVGFGAYGVVYFSNTWGLGFFGGTLVTLLIAAAIGALIGLFSLKVEGIYLAIATLFVGEILLQIFKKVTWFSGGFSGVRFHYPEFNLGFTTIELSRNFTFIFILLILLLIMVGTYNLTQSRTGRALMAMSRSEHAAQAMGISLMKYRLTAFIYATVLASLGGVLYVSFFRFVDPTGWNLNLSLQIIAMVVVGGFKSIFGTVIGVYIIYGIPQFFLKEFFASASGFSYIFSGVLIILVVMFYPYGAVYIRHDIKKLYTKLKTAREGDTDE